MALALIASAVAILARPARMQRLARGAGASSPFAVGSPAIRDIGGMGLRGKVIGFPSRQRGERFVTFVIREATVKADCAYWNSVARDLAHLRARRPPRLAAFCNSVGCAAAADRTARFPVIAFAENVLLLQARRLDLRGDALEVNARGIAVLTIGWRHAPPSFTAHRLEAAQ